MKGYRPYLGTSRKEIKAVQKIQKIADSFPDEGENIYINGLTALSAQTKSMTDRQAPVYIAIAIILAVVVFPHPEGPKRVTNSFS